MTSLKTNKYNGIALQSFKGQRYRVGYQSSKKTITSLSACKKTTQFINSIIRYNRF